MHFNQEARAKPLEHIIFILDLTVSQNINRFIVLTFYHSPYRKYGPFWEISCGADIERWRKFRAEKAIIFCCQLFAKNSFLCLEAALSFDKKDDI